MAEPPELLEALVSPQAEPLKVCWQLEQLVPEELQAE